MKERRRLREKEASERYIRHPDHLNVCVGAWEYTALFQNQELPT